MLGQSPPAVESVEYPIPIRLQFVDASDNGEPIRFAVEITSIQADVGFHRSVDVSVTAMVGNHPICHCPQFPFTQQFWNRSPPVVKWRG